MSPKGPSAKDLVPKVALLGSGGVLERQHLGRGP